MSAGKTTPRRHHYVWQHYLRPWTTQKRKSNQIWCLRRGNKSPIHVDTKNVAVERDFYRLPELQPGDLEFVWEVGLPKQMNPFLRRLNEDLIRCFEQYFQVQALGRNHPKAQPELIDELNRNLIELDERSYSKMESDAVEQLLSLVGGDVSFFQSTTQAIQFCHYLVHQYFRTKGMREQLRNYAFLSEEARDRFDRTWPIFRRIFANNVAASVFMDRRSAPLRVVRAAPGSEFITSDQPVVNTHAAFVEPGPPGDELELYYPISPFRAVILSKHSLYDGKHGEELGGVHVHYLNQTIERLSNEQIFARTSKVLSQIAPNY